MRNCRAPGASGPLTPVRRLYAWPYCQTGVDLLQEHAGADQEPGQNHAAGRAHVLEPVGRQKSLECTLI